MDQRLTNSFLRVPFLRITIPFILGIVGAGYFIVKIYLLLALVGVAVSAYFLLRNSLWRSFALVCGLFFAGFTIAESSRLEYQIPRGERITAQLEVTDIPYALSESRWQKTTAQVECYRRVGGSSEKWHKCGEHIIFYIDTCFRMDVGQHLTCFTYVNALGEYGNPYVNLMKTRGVTGKAYLTSTNLLEKSKEVHESIFYDAKRIQKQLAAKLHTTQLSKRDGAILTAILTGDRSTLDPETYRDYSRTGVSHVLALSGLHLTILFFILNILLKPVVLIGRRGFLIKTILIILLIWGYSTITGLSLSILRAALMLTILQISLLVGSRSNVYNSLFLSAFIILIISPAAIYDISFQLSYLAVFGIIFFHPRIFRLWNPPKLLRPIWNMTSVALAAQICVMPLIVYVFNYIPLLNLFVNPLIMMTTPIIMVAGFIYLSLSGIQIAEWVTGSVMELVFYIQNNAIAFTSSLSFATIDRVDLSLGGTFLCYGMILGVVVWIKYREIRKQIGIQSEVLTRFKPLI